MTATSVQREPVMIQLTPLLWTAALALLWPALQLTLFAARFGGVDGARMAESAVFLPMGLVGGAALVWRWRRARGRAGRLGAALGYALAIPVALAGSLLGGLLLPPLLGTLLLGGLPLAAGAVVGGGVGSALDARFSSSREARAIR